MLFRVAAGLVGLSSYIPIYFGYVKRNYKFW
jgi:hypothetical protein